VVSGGKEKGGGEIEFFVRLRAKGMDSSIRYRGGCWGMKMGDD